MSLGYAKAATDGAYRTKNKKKAYSTDVGDDLYVENGKRIELLVGVIIVLNI